VVRFSVVVVVDFFVVVVVVGLFVVATACAGDGADFDLSMTSAADCKRRSGTPKLDSEIEMSV